MHTIRFQRSLTELFFLEKITSRIRRKYLSAFFFSLSVFVVSGQAPPIRWQKCFGGGLFDYGYSIASTSDGGNIIAGYSESSDGDLTANHGGGDCWLVKHDNWGAIQWQKSLGGTGFDYGYSVVQTTDGGYAVAGYSESANGDLTGNNGGGDCWIIRLNNSGSIVWQKSYGGSANDNAQTLQQTSDGGFIVIGYSESLDGDISSSHGGGDCWVLKLDTAGSLQWQTSLGGSGYDFGQYISETTDGGFIIVGGSESIDGDLTSNHGLGDAWVIKIDSNGNSIMQRTLGGSYYDYGQSIKQTTDGGYIFIGYSESADGDVSGSHGGGDCWVVKLNSAFDIEWQNSLGGSDNDYGFSISETIGGDFIGVGYSASVDGDLIANHGGTDCWGFKLAPSGLLLWQNSYGGSGTDIGYGIAQNADGSYSLTGFSNSLDGDVNGNHTGGDCWVINLEGVTTKIIDQDPAALIKVYPNPSNGQFNIVGLYDKNQIQVFDLLGQSVFSSVAYGSKISVDIGSVKKGVYLLKVVSVNTYFEKESKIILSRKITVQ